MANNLKSKNKTAKAVTKKTPEKAATLSTSNSSYLDEKDRKAIEF